VRVEPAMLDVCQAQRVPFVPPTGQSTPAADWSKQLALHLVLFKQRPDCPALSACVMANPIATIMPSLGMPMHAHDIVVDRPVTLSTDSLPYWKRC